MTSLTNPPHFFNASCLMHDQKASFERLSVKLFVFCYTTSNRKRSAAVKTLFLLRQQVPSIRSMKGKVD